MNVMSSEPRKTLCWRNSRDQDALKRHARLWFRLKSSAWSARTQDERRAIFDAQSHHNLISMQYLPAIARRLHQCRDLSESELFDFLTWFEFTPQHSAAFDAMLAQLRATEEWTYVERDVEIRLIL